MTLGQAIIAATAARLGLDPHAHGSAVRLAAKLGVSDTTAKCWRDGGSSPPADKAAELAARLGFAITLDGDGYSVVDGGSDV